MHSSTSEQALKRLSIPVVLALLVVGLAYFAPSSEARGTKNCADFRNQQAAQLFYLSYDGPANLVRSMDGNRDGVVCENLSGPRYTREQLPTVYRHLQAKRTKGSITMNSVGSRYPRAAIQIKGYVSGATPGLHKIVLQKRGIGSTVWVRRATKFVRNGAYRFPNQSAVKPGVVRFRARLFSGGRVADVSNVVAVRVVPLPPPTCESAPSPTTCPQPAPDVELHTIDVPPVDCTTFTMPTADQTRSREYEWDTAARAWVFGDWTDWVTVATGSRAATLTECPGDPGDPGEDALLPDVGIRKVTTCSPAELASTSNNTCFKIVYPTTGQLAGERFLKFPVTTINIGEGPAELNAHRPSAESTNEDDWTANQRIFNTDGSVSDIPATDVGFYWAGDGHSHWHVRDFDHYSLLDEEGEEIAVAEKHGYCLEDNTTYGPMQGHPRVPVVEAYEHARMCGLQQPATVDVTHGMSRGWGDTYPSTLPDQGILITGLPDGIYTLVVYADQADAVIESNEDNNISVVQLQITGDLVTPLNVATGL